MRPSRPFSCGGLLAGCGATHHRPALGRAERVASTSGASRPEHADARAGSLVIVVHNSGRLAHNLLLSRDGVRVSSTPPIMPGQDADLAATVQKGSYEMLSSMVDDEATGVYGTLNVG